jgi:hypothetical protein
MRTTEDDSVARAGGAWCDCSDTPCDPDDVPVHDIRCMYGGDPKRTQFKARCRCWEPPVTADGPITMLEHDAECGYPERRCENDAHRMFIHAACGRPVRMRFCGCTSTDHGYTHDTVRGWWVHYVCGWPTKAWYEGSGSPSPPELEGVKPVTYHEYRAVPKTPARAWKSLNPGQQLANDRAVGAWLWD